jgi:hypothetical protein
MKSVNKMLRVALVAAIAAALGGASTRAMAANAKCPECEMPNEKGTAVTLKQGGKTVTYRCVFCVLDQAENDIKGNLSISAPTEKAGRNITIKRVGSKWSATPGASFVAAQQMRHRTCPETYRAFSSRAAAQSYIAKNRALVGNVAPLNLTQMLKVAKD